MPVISDTSVLDPEVVIDLDILKAKHVDLAATLSGIHDPRQHDFEVLPHPSNEYWLDHWEEISGFGMYLTGLLVKWGYDATLHIRPQPPHMAAEVRLPLTEDCYMRIRYCCMRIRYCCISMEDRSPFYYIGVEHGKYESWAPRPSIDYLPNLIDYFRTSMQCSDCHYSADYGRYCGKGLVGNGYCSGYSPCREH